MPGARSAGRGRGQVEAGPVSGAWRRGASGRVWRITGAERVSGRRLRTCLRAGWAETWGGGGARVGCVAPTPCGRHVGTRRAQACRATVPACGIAEGLCFPLSWFSMVIELEEAGRGPNLTKAFPELLCTWLSFETFTKKFF